jgi:four helix bundle protein
MGDDGSTSESIRSYKDLKVWKASVDLAADVYKLTRSFPRDEIYGLTSQMRRAGVSIAANIAEGYGRQSTANYIQFLRVAQGSTKELETHVAIAERIALLDVATSTELQSRIDQIGRMLRGLIQ